MKVWALAANEDWVCDRFVSEWNERSGHSAPSVAGCDVAWLLSDWCWRQVPRGFLTSRPVVATVHHIVPEKFGPRELSEFKERDALVTAYHVPCKKTHEQLSAVLAMCGTAGKPVLCQPFWVNASLWRETESVDDENIVPTRQRLTYT